MINKFMLIVAVMLSFFWTSTNAGTLTAEKIEAGEVLVSEIGLYEPINNGVLFFPFTSSESNSVTDESGNGYNGKPSGCYWKESGPHGGCMVFDGFGDYIDVGPALNVPTWDQYSISVWFLHDGKGDFTAGYGHKIIDRTSYYHDWHLRVYPPSGALTFVMYEGRSGGLWDGSRNYMDNTWHHVVVTRDGSAGEMWVDGVLKSTTATTMVSVKSTSNLCVGNSFSTDAYQRKSWSGMIDELRIYDYPLSQSEVTQLYNDNHLSAADTPGSIVVSTNLVVTGGMTASGSVSFTEGVIYSKPLGGLSCGIYTNTP
jgi:hypothetical protein